jgi:hypothetical protein
MWDPYKKSIYFDTLNHNATVSDFYPNIIIVAKVKSHLPVRLVYVTHACSKQIDGPIATCLASKL